MATYDLLIAEQDRSKWASIKCREIVKDTSSLSIVNRDGGFKVELLNVINAGYGILDVYARAWQGNNQIGFDADGSVDIERFRFHNPRILVPDPSGTIKKQEVDPDTGKTTTFTYREDLRECLLYQLEHTIKVKKLKVNGSKNIINGKKGNTTDTFYSGAGDGYVNAEGANFGDIRTSTSGTDAFPTLGSTRFQCGRFGGTTYYIRRSFFPFDTSSLPTGLTISTATFSVYPTVIEDSDNDSQGYVVPVGPTSQADTSTLVVGDFDQCDSPTAPTKISDTDLDLTSATTGAYYDWTLNSSGLSLIDDTGFTLIGGREGHDIEGNIYAGGPNTSNNLTVSASEETGTSQDPKLVVEYTVSSVAGGIITNKLMLMALR